MIVVMTPEYEDEHTREYGLYCLLRILRTMSASTEESSLLTQYSGRYEIVQGDKDVIALKGTFSIQEDRPSAIQEIHSDMSYRTTTRRIQFAELSPNYRTSCTCEDILKNPLPI